VFQKVMAQYAEKLSKRLPDRLSGPLDSASIEAACCVIGTAEYCDETMPVFAEQLQRAISSDFKDRIDFGNERELQTNLQVQAYQALVQSVNCSLDESFSKMNRISWERFSQDVGDHSPYVGEIYDQLSRQFGPVARSLSRIHYRLFCHKFVEAFVKRYVEEIHRCRKISVRGAQQLLHDTTLIRTHLLEVPVVAGNGGKMQTSYSNFVLREMGRAETMLKVLSSPDGVDASVVRAMLGDDHPEAEVRALLALRADGARDAGAALGDDDRSGTGVASLGSSMLSLSDSLIQKGQRAPEDLKKNFMDMRKNVGKLGFTVPGFSATKKTGSSSAAPQ